MPGVNEPYLYVGSWRSMFAWWVLPGCWVCACVHVAGCAKTAGWLARPGLSPVFRNVPTVLLPNGPPWYRHVPQAH